MFKMSSAKLVKLVKLEQSKICRFFDPAVRFHNLEARGSGHFRGAILPPGGKTDLH